MKFITAGVVMMGLIAAGVAFSEEDKRYVSNEVLIRYKPGTSSSEIRKIRQGLHAKRIQKFSSIKVQHYELPGNTSVEATLSQLKDSPKVLYAEPNYIVHINQLPNDPDFEKLYGPHNTGQTGGKPDADIDAPLAWDHTTGDPGIVIAVIDTGVDYNHPDLAANIWTNPKEVSGNKIDDDKNGYVDDIHGYDFANNDGDPMDDNDHGTHVAGTIAAVGNNGIGVVGVVWVAKIMALKFLDAQGSGSLADAIEAINYATLMKAKISNNSWGGGDFSQALRDAILANQNAGALFIAAAGNEGSNNDTNPSYPATYNLEGIVSVAATDDNDELAYFSNTGATTVDLAAPGVAIYSTLPSNSYGSLSGTSMATPHVTGAAALVWVRLPHLTNLEVKNTLLMTTDSIPTLSGKIKTGGRLNVFNFMDDDVSPPVPVTDLALEKVSLFEIKLRCTASGDDALSGQASRYDLRYSTTTMTDENWDSAAQVYGLAPPKAVGEIEIFTVTGLSPNTTYHFALKVIDNVGNSSPLSNVAIGTTAQSTLIYQENFENGTNGWTLGGDLGQRLWHISKRRAFDPLHAFYYGKETDGTYDTGARTSGWIMTPSISLNALKSSTLIFHHFLETEDFPPYDLASILVSQDSGVNWTTIYESFSTYGKWEKVMLDLSPYDGKNILIKFSFDTVDETFNGYEGWYVDSIQVLAEGVTDSMPPLNITDLAAKEVQTHSAILEWTASGDDGTLGQASSYDFRYSLEPITESNFLSSTKASDVPSPSPSGTRESFEVKGLSLETRYYFALKVHDEASHASDLSNIVTVKTKAGPKLALTPATLPKVIVDKGKTDEQILTFQNLGDESLTYDISIGPANTATRTSPNPKATYSSSPGAVHIRGQVLVKFKKSIQAETIHNLSDQFNAKTLKIFQEIGVHLIETPSDRNALELARSYLASGLVEYAEPNYKVHISHLPNDPEFSKLWGMHNTAQTGGASDADIDAPEAWDKTQGSSNMIAAVIDTGVDYNHPDLKANMWKNPIEIAGNNIDDDNNGYVDDVKGWDFANKDNDPFDDNEHGTHVAGTIGAVGSNNIGVVGINWRVRIMPLKFLDAEGSGSLSDAVLAILYAANNGAKILNNSWGGGDYSQTLFAAIKYANSKNALFIAAAGNDGTDNDQTPAYPASYKIENVIAVAATDHNDVLAYFSNTGATSVHLAAPGVQIYSTLPSNQYGYLSGTSMATPHVSGACALVWAAHPDWNHLKVKKQILATDPSPNLAGKTITGGRLNVQKASEELETTPPSPVADLIIKGSSYSTIGLQWTSTGDNGSIGKARSYEIRYSPDLITEQNFNLSTLVGHALSPQPSGIEEALLITNLFPNTLYYFALKVMDDAGNVSNLSNIASGKTEDALVIYKDAMETPSNWTATGLWHSTSFRANSPSHAFYYGDEYWKDYYTGTTHSGTLTSPVIDLTQGIMPQLSFRYWREVESSTLFSVDKTYLEVSKDGGASWDILWYRDAKDPSEKAWTSSNPIDLTPYKGNKIILRFVFDTVDPYLNFYEGFYVDDVQVLGQKPDLSWLSIQPQSGAIPAQQSQGVKLMYDSAQLQPGTYKALLNIAANDPRQSSLNLPIEIEVIEDLTPPATILDLAIVSITNNALNLSWTAPGDDEIQGTANAYDIRFSASIITAENFYESSPLTNSNPPQPSGSLETLIVTHLDLSNHDYYFAIKTIDKRMNVSNISNLAVWYRPADLDQDGLTNHEELLLGSNPLSTDTDLDGVNDLLEMVSGTILTDPTSYQPMIFNDDFNSPSFKGWSITGANVWSVSNGDLKSLGTGSYSFLNLESVNISRLMSFAIEYRVEFPKKCWGGILLGGIQIDINPYQIAIRNDSRNDSLVRKPGLKLGPSDILLLIRKDETGYRCSLYANAIPIFQNELLSKTLKTDTLALISPYTSGFNAFYKDFTLWPDPDLALKPFVDNFYEESFARWIASGNTSGIAWGFKSKALQAKPLKPGTGYGFLHHALMDVRDRDLLLRSRIFYGGGAKWGGLMYRRVHFDCNPARIGFRDADPKYITPGLSPNAWHQVIFLVKHASSGDRATLWLNGIEILKNELIQMKGDYKDSKIGFISNFYQGYVLFDDVEITTVKPGENLEPILLSPVQKKVRGGSLLSFQLKALDTENDRLTYRVHGLPPGATFDPITGKFNWRTLPSDARAQFYELIFEVSDGVKTDRKKMKIIVDGK